MRETILSALPPCFEKWCQKFDDLFKTKGQKKGFRYYLAGLLGESKRKNIAQMTNNFVDASYNNIYHFISFAQWDENLINERRLKIMNKGNQTKIRNGFSLIIDDSGHRKSGNFTGGVGRQYLGEIGKTDNGVVIVTTHLYDGVRSLPLDVELYQNSSSLPDGKEDKKFVKKPDLALRLVQKTLERKYRPGVVLVDGGYGNNSSFLQELERLELNYIGGLAQNRLVSVINQKTGKKQSQKRLDEIGLSLPQNAFQEVTLEQDIPKTVFVGIIEVEIKGLTGPRTIAIVMNNSSISEATEIDYLITNKQYKSVTEEWIVKTYSDRNYIEKFYREAKGWLGLKEYQVRDKTSMRRHFILVFVAYTFIVYQQLMGGLRKRYSRATLTNFTETLEAFLTGVSYKFFCWLQENQEIFAQHKADLGVIWG